MKSRKVISVFLALLCIFTSLAICPLGVAAEGARHVTATTETLVMQGSFGYLYVYLDDMTNLSALNLSVYYDREKVTVSSAYNVVSSLVCDISTGDDAVNASYIFDGEGTKTNTNLFYIRYQVNDTAEIGDTYFDIVVNEAFDSSLDAVDIGGSRCHFEITEKSVSKYCSISSTHNVYTGVKEEFELSYSLSTYQIASGSMSVVYDPELFEVVSVTNGGFLKGKIADVNTELDGEISLSFVGTSYQTNYDVITVRFRTVKNVSETSDISLLVKELYDKDLNLYSCFGFTTQAHIALDENYTDDAPAMRVDSVYDQQSGKVTASVTLEKDSMLGAGDFVLEYDTNYLKYVSSEMGFDPTFSYINDKNASDGVIKFSIISLSDITKEQLVLYVVFDTSQSCQDNTAVFKISGSGITDSLTNPIRLNFVDSSVLVPLRHIEGEAVEENRVDPKCTEKGSYESVVYCSICDAELSREPKSVDELGHDEINHSAQKPTCVDIGWNAYVTCSRCDYSTYEELPAAGHSYEHTVVPPTVDSHGYTRHVCSVCKSGYEDSFVDKLIYGDLDGNRIVDDADAAYLVWAIRSPVESSDMYPLNQVCDFDKNGAVNEADAVYLLMYTVFPQDYPL